MKPIVLSISFFIVTLMCSAQELHIVKDNINCTYGLKNQAGNWVVEPNYILIQQYNSRYFLATDVMGDGILDSTGKEIIECIYDEIYTTNPHWVLNNAGYNYSSSEGNTFFKCVVGESQDLINTEGVKIASLDANNTFKFDGNQHLMIYSSNPSTTSYIDAYGNILIDKKAGVILPFEGREYSLLGDRIGSSADVISGNGRLVNRAGEVILNEKFERARIISNDRIAFEKNGCYGVMTITGKVIIPPNYRAENNLYAPEQLGGSWAIYDKNNRVGRMRTNGTIMIEPRFDEISPLYTSNAASQDVWQVHLNGKFGIIDSTSWLQLPVEYDRILPVLARLSEEAPYTRNYIVEKAGKFAYLKQSNAFKEIQFFDSLLVPSSYPYCKGLIAKKNGKYGVLNPDGSVRVQCVYDSHFNREYDSDIEYLSIGKTFVEFTFSNDSIFELKWQPYLVDGAINYYTDSKRYWSLTFSKSKNAFVGFDQEHSYDISDDLFIIHPKYPEDKRIYSRKTKLRLPIHNITEIYRIQGNHYQIRTRTNEVGVMNGQGKIILKQIYSGIQENRNSTHIWAAKPTSTYTSKWILMDTSGRQVTPDLFDECFEVNSGDQIAYQNKRTGLIDSETLRWKIPPTYHCLFRSSGDYYVLLSDANKKGIIRNDGKFILEPIYDSILLLTSNCGVNWICKRDASTEIRWWVKRGNSEMLVDQDGKQETSPQLIRSFFESLLFEDTLLLAEDDKLRVFPRLDYTPSLHFLRGLTPEQIRRKRADLWENPTLKRSVFDTIFERWKTKAAAPGSIYGISPVASYVWIEGQYSEQEWKIIEQERKLKEICACAQSTAYRATTNSTFRLKSIGPQFVSIDNLDQRTNYNGWDIEVGAQTQAPTFLLNFVMKNGKVMEVQLEDIFPLDSVLMEEFIIALKKRDDLQLNCSSLEMMVEMIDGKFSLSESGVHLYLNQQSLNRYGSYSPVELLIPSENLSNHSGCKWIVPILLNE